MKRLIIALLVLVSPLLGFSQQLSLFELLHHLSGKDHQINAALQEKDTNWVVDFKKSDKAVNQDGIKNTIWKYNSYEIITLTLSENKTQGNVLYYHTENKSYFDHIKSQIQAYEKKGEISLIETGTHLDGTLFSEYKTDKYQIILRVIANDIDLVLFMVGVAYL